MSGKPAVYSVGNYTLTGKVFGKGHFARVEEATHKIIGKKVAIKIIDLTLIREEYARRNLHREPRVMARLQHPCIAALYETMLHGPRLYVAMEAAGGGDLCALVLAARGGRGGRGLPEPAARALAAQLVSAVRHMHARGVVHRDLKMENIMLDSTKQFIKIVDFGLSNVWGCGAALRTPCGSLEYAAPELFVDGRRYGPEVDLWSVGVIVYGMVTGSLPFAGAGAESASRAQLRAAIARGFGRKQRDALAPFTTECKSFVEHLLQARVEARMRAEEAARHRWVRRPGLHMRRHPFSALDPKYSRALYRQIAELCGVSFADVVSQVKSNPFGPTAGMYNIKVHLHQLKTGGTELWTASTEEPRPATPPEYHASAEHNIPTEDRPVNHTHSHTNGLKMGVDHVQGHTNGVRMGGNHVQGLVKMGVNNIQGHTNGVKMIGNHTQGQTDGVKMHLQNQNITENNTQSQNAVKTVLKHVQTLQFKNGIKTHTGLALSQMANGSKATPRQVQTKTVKTDPAEIKQTPLRKIDPKPPDTKEDAAVNNLINDVKKILQSPPKRPTRIYGAKKPSRLGTGDGVETRLTSIQENSERSLARRVKEIRLNSCPNPTEKRNLYKRGGDGVSSWRNYGFQPLSARHAVNTVASPKRLSLGSTLNPPHSTPGRCGGDRAVPVGWLSNRIGKNYLQRLRRTAPMK